MSWLYLPEQAADCSDADYLAGRQSAMWKTNGTALMYSKPGSQMGFWMTPRSGTMPEHLTGSPGLDWWMYLQRASHASRSVSQESREPNLMSEICGRTPFASLEKSGQNGAYWRTSQACFPGLMDTLDEYCENWPRAGMTVDGTAYQRVPLAPVTGGTGYGLWPTPTTLDTIPNRSWESQKDRHSLGLVDAAKWSTPTAMDSLDPKSEKALMREATEARPGRSRPANLRDQVMPESVKLWPSPNANPPGWKNIDVVDRNGNPPEHPNQRFYDKETGRLVQKGLEQVVKLWPTPHAHLCHHGGASLNASLRRQRMGKQLGLDMVAVIENGKLEKPVSGQLNPDWVEWLMGWPLFWTDINRVPEYDSWINGEQSWEDDPADTGEIPRVTAQKANRVNRLKAIGNGQVPLCMAIAWELLSNG